MNAILLAILLTTAAPPFEVQTLDGRTVVGRLDEMSADRVTIDLGDGSMTLDIDQIMAIAPQEKTSQMRSDAALVVTLIDGSTIPARKYTVEKTEATLVTAGDDAIKMPIDAVKTVCIRPMPDELQSEWAKLAERNDDSDLLVVRNENHLDYHQGVLHDISDDAVQFDLDGEILPVKRTKIVGFVYRHGDEDELPATACRIKDDAGSVWSARSLKPLAKSDGVLQWTTPAGLDISQPLDRIVQIDFSGGKLVYLSDLTPESVQWTPYFNMGKQPETVERFYAPRFDRNFDSSPLQLGGTQYRKGLALHSRTEMVFRLPDRFGRFRAVAGIADSMRPGGSVRLLIRGDGRDLFDAVLTGNDPPQPLDLDLTGVRRLTVVVDFGDSLGMGDSLLLCNARLGK